MMSISRRSRAAFSLIELVVVMLVLAIVSGLVVTLAGWVRRSANYGSSAHSQSSVMANLEFFRTTYGNNAYPDRFDSLLDATGAVPTYIDPELQAMITPAPVDAGYFDSLRGITTVMRHVPTSDNTVLQGNPGNTGTVEDPLASGDNVAFLNPTSANGIKLINMIYGSTGIPADTNLVLFGVGPRSSLIGRSIQSPPFDSNVDPSKVYNRFVAVFAVYNPREGRRAQLKAVLSAKGRTHNEQLSEFWQSANPE